MKKRKRSEKAVIMMDHGKELSNGVDRLEEVYRSKISQIEKPILKFIWNLKGP